MSLILTIIVLGALGVMVLAMVQQGTTNGTLRRRAERYAAKVGYACAKLDEAAGTPGLDALTRDALRIEARNVAAFLENGGRDA